MPLSQTSFHVVIKDAHWRGQIETISNSTHEVDIISEWQSQENILVVPSWLGERCVARLVQRVKISINHFQLSHALQASS